MSASPYSRLAERSVRYFLERGKPLPCSEEMSKEFNQKAGAFVSIKIKGALRGCIGAIRPQEKSLAEEIIYNAISAATKDPRFSPVSKEELDELTKLIEKAKAEGR